MSITCHLKTICKLIFSKFPQKDRLLDSRDTAPCIYVKRRIQAAQGVDCVGHCDMPPRFLFKGVCCLPLQVLLQQPLDHSPSRNCFSLSELLTMLPIFLRAGH